MSVTKKVRCDILTLIVLCIPFMYVLLASIFPTIRIPFSLLSETSTESFNRVMEGLSIGYLSGVFIYFLTTFVRGKAERKQRFSELYYFFNDTYDVVRDLEKEFGKDAAYFDIDDYRMYTEELHKEFLKKLNKQLDRTLNFRDILLPEEVDKISEIERMRKGIEPYYDGMQEKEKVARADTLISVCKLINDLRESITKEIQNKGKH